MEGGQNPRTLPMRTPRPGDCTIYYILYYMVVNQYTLDHQ